MYVAIRGWLAVAHEQRAAVEAVIRQHDEGFYSGGWSFPAKPFNWTLYVFYGGDIRESGVPWFRRQLEQLASLTPVDEDNDLPRGVFMLSDERENTEMWLVRDGAVHVQAAPEFGWLNE
jgi:hypothetical protein